MASEEDKQTRPMKGAQKTNYNKLDSLAGINIESELRKLMKFALSERIRLLFSHNSMGESSRGMERQAN